MRSLAPHTSLLFRNRERFPQIDGFLSVTRLATDREPFRTNRDIKGNLEIPRTNLWALGQLLKPQRRLQEQPWFAGRAF